MKTYLVDFSIGGVMCRLTTLTGEYVEEYHSRYYNHKHAFFEIHYVTKGRFRCTVEDVDYEISAGQLLIIQPGCDHFIFPLTEEKSKMCLGFDVYRTIILGDQDESREFADLFYKEKAVLLKLDDIASRDKIASILGQFCAMYYQDKLTMTIREELKSLTSLLLLCLSKELRLRSTAEDLFPSESEKNRNYWVDEFFTFNFQRNDGYELLAKQLNVSTRQLDRILKKDYGMGYQRILLEYRLGVAMNLLHNTDKPIEEISEIVGYSSTSSFSAFIRRETNRTPSEIRKGMKS